ncbi:hypothetical protein ILUMI_00069 [Ignelater luminosus]|uniref:Transporter n=1 Tax=Ignelater luminosus TaxID=2038154 RepID=A0A8K0DN15_IGNLU|nr:hypothetical protein ILUMI_00069 [Ignelater luminosus]
MRISSVKKLLYTPQVLEKRSTWGNGMEFLMSCIAMSVGLGNVWRFPFTAYENGGGAFLIPYIIVLTLVGRPVYFMEMCVGQFSSKGNVKMFETLAPVLKGVGYGQLFGTICVATYYCSLMAITLFYLVNSFTSELPWAECNPEWKDDNFHCVPSGYTGKTSLNNSISSSELWFTKEVLKEKTNIEDGIGLPEWRLTIFLLISWLVTFTVTAKGIQSSGKASYFLAIFPYVIMIALLIRSATLNGSAAGIMYLLSPQWEKLTSSKVWYNAITQCFYSLNIGFGSIIMYASYNDFRHNIYRDALIVTSLDTLASLLSGITIFGILGNLAHELGVDVTEVINSGGARLAFVSYPDAIAKFDAVPWLFAILFFVMLFVLGVGSLVALQACAFTVIKDAFPSLRNWHVSLITALIGFLIGLVYITPGGQFVLTMVDYFGATFVFFILTTSEVLVILWWYGLENFCADIEFMLKRKVGLYWRVCWGIITPIVLIAIFIYFLLSLEKLKNGIYDYPDVALNCGWVLVAFGLSQPLIWWLIYLYRKRKLGILQAILDSFSFKSWGPKDAQNCDEWKKFKFEKAQELSAKKNMTWLQQKIYFIVGK